LGIVQLIEFIAFTIPFSYFPNYAVSLGAQVASIGLYTSSFMLAMALLSPKIGALSDRFGRKRILLLGLLGDVVVGSLSGLAPNWIWLLLIRIVNGAASAAAMLPAEALLIDLVPEQKRGEVSGFVMAMGMIGRSIGPVFGGLIQWSTHSFGFTLLNSYRIPYFVDSLLAALAVALVAYRVKEPKHLGRRPEKHNPTGVGGHSTKVKLSTSIKVLLVNSFVAGIGVGFIMPISVLFYTDKFGIEPFAIGLIISVTGFIGISATWFAGRLSDKIGRKPVVAFGGIVSRICTLALPLTFNINQATTVTAIRSLGFNIFMPAMRALRADVVPEEYRGRVFGMFMTAFTAGDIIGPIIGTWLYSLYRFETLEIGTFFFPGYGIPFLVNAVIGLISIIFVIFLVEEKRLRATD
jgi:MFS family permease